MEVVLHILLFATLVGSTLALPGSYFPINSQVPPVARINEPFEFVFSPYTFTSTTNSPISYSLVDSPTWLSIDSNERRLHGTPQEEDMPEGEVVGISLDLVGEDDEGAASMEVTLVVSRNPSPTVNRPLVEQITTFGSYSLPSSISSMPSTDFSIDFADDTFSGGGLSFYAIMGDNSPLPSWVSFDDGKLEFSGTTPSVETLIQPPQTFTFQLVASDVLGFSAAKIQFSLLVGGRQLVAAKDVVIVEATPGQELSYPGPLDDISLDGQPIAPAEVKSVSAADVPTWLSLDFGTGALSGTPPMDAEPINVTLTVEDTYLNKVSLTVWVQLATSLFQSNLPITLDIAAGEPFELDLSPYFSDKADVDISVNTMPAVDWVKFDPTSMVISGKAPMAADGSDFELRVDAKSKSSSAAESRALKVSITEPGDRGDNKSDMTKVFEGISKSAAASPTSLKTQISPSASQLTEATTVPPAPSHGTAGGLKPYTLALIIVLPIVFLILMALLICCLIQRRNKKRKRRVKVEDISGPVPESFVRNGTLTSEHSSSHQSLAELAKNYDIGDPGPHPALPPIPRQSAMTTWSALRRTGTDSSFENSVPGTALSTYGAYGVSNAPPSLPPLFVGKRGTRVVQNNGNRRDTWLSNDEFLRQSSREENKTKSFLTDTSFYHDGNSSSTGPSGQDHNVPSNFTLERGGGGLGLKNSLGMAIPEGRGSIQNTPDQAYDCSIGPEDIEGPSKRRSKMLATAIASGRTTPNVAAVPWPSGSQKKTLANRVKSGTGFNFFAGWKSQDDGPSPLNRRSHLMSTAAGDTTTDHSPGLESGSGESLFQLDPVGPTIVAPKQARLSVQQPNRQSHRRSRHRWFGNPKPVPPPPAGTPNPTFWGSTLGPGTDDVRSSSETVVLTSSHGGQAAVAAVRDSDGSYYPPSISDAFPRPPITGLASSGGESLASRRPGSGIGGMGGGLKREDSLTGRGPRNSLGIAYKDLIRKSPYHPSILSVQSDELADDLPAGVLALEPVLEATRSREDGLHSFAGLASGQVDRSRGIQGGGRHRQSNLLPAPPEKSPKRPTTAGKAFGRSSWLENGNNVNLTGYYTNTNTNRQSSSGSGSSSRPITTAAAAAATQKPQTPDWRGSKSKDDFLSPSRWDLADNIPSAIPSIPGTSPYSNSSGSGDGTLIPGGGETGNGRRPPQTKSSEALKREVRSRFSDVSLRVGSGNGGGGGGGGGRAGNGGYISTSRIPSHQQGEEKIKMKKKKKKNNTRYNTGSGDDKSWGSQENVRTYGGMGRRSEDEEGEDFAVYI